MTALGQQCPKLLRLPSTKSAIERMGKVLPKGDIRGANTDRNSSEVASSFDYLVDARQERRGDRKAECLCGGTNTWGLSHLTVMAFTRPRQLPSDNTKPRSSCGRECDLPYS